MNENTPEQAPLPVVWIVDDTLADATRVARALESLAQCEIFQHGGAMLERLAAHGAPDVVLLDWHLPELSGIELCRFLRERFDQGELPILLITVMSSGTHVADALEQGANDFVRKPFDEAELRARVGAALRTQRLFTRARSAEQALSQERKRLLASEAKFKALANSGIIGIMTMDLAGNVIEANATLLNMVGCSRTDLAAGRIRMRDLTGSEYLKRDDCALHELLVHGACERYEKVIERADGVRVSVLQGAAMIDRQTAIAYLLDVSEQRGLEADRTRLFEAERSARADAERASSLKDEFLATVSHELRTPLNAILGWSQVGRRKTQPADLNKAFDVIERNVRTQSKLIEDILDISQIVSGKMSLELTEFDACGAVEPVVAELQGAAAAKQVALEAEVPADLQLVADEKRLRQVLSGLLANALKFTPEQGRISVRVEQTASATRFIVSDSGRGIDPKFLPHVFDRFRQADSSATRSHGGLGLGLAIAHHLVERHGGQLQAHSPGLGQGSTFVAEIPLSLTAESKRPVSVAPGRSMSGFPAGALTGIRVLLVEDDSDSRTFLHALLEQHGATVASAESAQQAFGAFERQPPHVLVTDIAMAGEDGYQLVRRIRQLPDNRSRQVPAIALTAYARNEDRRRSLAEGFQMHLTKPIDVQQLISAVLSIGAPEQAAAG